MKRFCAEGSDLEVMSRSSISPSSCVYKARRISAVLLPAVVDCLHTNFNASVPAGGAGLNDRGPDSNMTSPSPTLILSDLTHPPSSSLLSNSDILAFGNSCVRKYAVASPVMPPPSTAIVGFFSVVVVVYVLCVVMHPSSFVTTSCCVRRSR